MIAANFPADTSGACLEGDWDAGRGRETEPGVRDIVHFIPTAHWPATHLSPVTGVVVSSHGPAPSFVRSTAWVAVG